MAEEKQKLVRVRVRVPDRSGQGFPGYWAVQRLWPNGDSEAVIPEDKLEELKAEKTFLAVVSETPTTEGDPNVAPAPVTGDAPKRAAPQEPEPQGEDKHGPARKLTR